MGVNKFRNQHAVDCAKAARRIAIAMGARFDRRCWYDLYKRRAAVDAYEEGSEGEGLREVDVDLAYGPHAGRFVEAVALGEIADMVFAEEARKVGVPTSCAFGDSPLLRLELARRDGTPC